MIGLDKWEKLRARMSQLGIREKDLEEKFIRSSGRGGQNVNKLSTCVYLKHLPSGIEVKCQKTRSQQDNRFFARRILAEKLEMQKEGKKSAEEKRRYKLRKQKQKRSKRAKEKISREKKIHSEKKELRKKPSVDH